MAIVKKQYYGVKYPFTIKNNDELFIDLNQRLQDKVASELLHVILTQKGTKIRRPDFGTDLITYIFEQNDNITWDSVENELKTAVSTFVPNAEITNLDILKSEQEDNALYLDIRYNVIKGSTKENNRMVVKL